MDPLLPADDPDDVFLADRISRYIALQRFVQFAAEEGFLVHAALVQLGLLDDALDDLAGAIRAQDVALAAGR